MMEDNEQEYDNFYYDDGRFADDDVEEERHDESDIPTYDELDLEGRYYEYGSREDYNAWRNSMINRQNYDYIDTQEDKKANIITFIVIAVIFFLVWCLL